MNNNCNVVFYEVTRKILGKCQVKIANKIKSINAQR